MPFAATKKVPHTPLAVVAGFSLVPALGVASFRLTAWCLYNSELGAGDASVTFVSRVMQFLVMILVLVVERRLTYSQVHLHRVCAAAAALMTLGAIVYLVNPEGTYRYLGCGINGAASAVLMLGWGYYFCGVNARVSAFGLTLGFCVYGLCTWLLTALSVAVIVVVVAVLPLLSYLCLRLSIIYGEVHNTPDGTLSFKSRELVPWGVFSLLLICMIISILAKLLVPMNELVATPNYQWYWPAIFLVIFILYALWMLVLKRDDQDQLWPVYVLVIFSGLLCYSTFSTTQPLFAASFFKATQECLMLFCWVVTASVVYKNQLPRVFCFALATLIFLQPPTLLSTMSSLFFPSAGLSGDEFQALLITASLTFVLVVATVVLIWLGAFNNTRHRQREHGQEHGQEHEREQIPTLSEAVQELTQAYGLTRRECEVLLYLAKGYSLPQTSKMLFISLDTVRTHTKSVYRKLGINKRQQLIDLIEQSGASR